MKNRLFLTAVVVVLVILAAGVGRGAGDGMKSLTGDEMRGDLEVLRRTLTTIHPGVYRYIAPAALDRAFADAAARLGPAASEGEFLVVVAQLVSRIDCGHTFANPLNQEKDFRARVFDRRALLPFYFRLIDDRMLVTADASPEKLARGSEILKIDGVPVTEIVARLLTVTRADGTSTRGHRLDSLQLTREEAERFALFDLYYPLFFPVKNDSFEFVVRDFKTGKIRTFRAAALTKSERSAAMAARFGPPPTYDDGWRFELRRNGTLGYLKIANSLTWRLTTVKFKEFLAAAFRELRARDVANLVIDLRGNGGGDMEPGFELARYLASKTLPPYAASRRLVRSVGPQPELAKYLDTYSDELLAGLKNGLPATAYKKAENGYYELLPDEKLESFPAVEPAADSFRGRAFVIADASNASATFQFLDYVKTHRLATIVGQPTGGSRQGINGGNYFFLHLPASRIEIDIPVYFQAPLAPQKDESVIPDVPVKRRPSDVGRDVDREMILIERRVESGE
ncbi:MAG: hypothetical protein JSS81_26635 [Acidobacteria bacterium]|nr:hypothetical protein [Acidobacteriota bacterium]